MDLLTHRNAVTEGDRERESPGPLGYVGLHGPDSESTFLHDRNNVGTTPRRGHTEPLVGPPDINWGAPRGVQGAPRGVFGRATFDRGSVFRELERSRAALKYDGARTRAVFEMTGQ